MNTLIPDIETWRPAHSPLVIEYARSVLDEVRDQAVAGYRRLSRGGVEVGGVLYGVREAERVRILATQPIPCEYKSGPSFILSDKDKHRLRNQLAERETVAELRELAVVGWYVSHPRGEIALGDRDLEIFNEFFPEIWNIALVMKPGENFVTGGFFVREPRGSLNFAQSYQEFEIGLPRSAEGASAVRQIADQVSSSLAAQRDSPSLSERRRMTSRREVAEMPMPASSTPHSRDVPRPFVSGSSAAAATAPVLDPSSSASWSTAVARPRAAIVAQRRSGASDHPRRLKWRYLILWAFVIAGAIGGLYVYREFTAPAPLGLRVAEKDGEMSFNWDPNSRSIQWASDGKLEIRSSALPKTEITLNKEQLSKGTYQYEASEGDMSIRLSVTGKIGFHAEEGTRFLGQLSAPEPNKPVEIRDRRKLQAEVNRLRDELDKSNQRVKELESLLYNR